MSKIPILTTGATGLVGSRLLELFEDEYEFYNMDLTVGIDITKPELIEEFISDHSANILIHFAAFTDVNKAFEQVGDKTGICYKVNVVGTQNIIDICKTHDIHLIHISTDFVFSGEQEEPYIEEDPRSPIEWYGETKAMAEELVENSGVEYTIARLAYPFRANFPDKPDIVAKIKKGLEDKTLYPQFSDMTITPTYIDDIVAGLEVMINLKPSGIFHLVGSSWVTPYDLAQKVASTFGFDPKIVEEGSLTEYLKSANRPYARNVKLSNNKAKKELGVILRTIDESLSDMTDN